MPLLVPAVNSWYWQRSPTSNGNKSGTIERPGGKQSGDPPIKCWLHYRHFVMDQNMTVFYIWNIFRLAINVFTLKGQYRLGQQDMESGVLVLD